VIAEREGAAETPRFSMRRADTAPVYATPARADAPVSTAGTRAAKVVSFPPPPPVERCDLPEPPSHGAGLIVAAVVWWTVVAGLVALCVCTYLLLARDAAPPPVCAVGPGRECPVTAADGRRYTAYYIAWSTSVGLASPTPDRRATATTAP